MELPLARGLSLLALLGYECVKSCQFSMRSSRTDGLDGESSTDVERNHYGNRPGTVMMAAVEAAKVSGATVKVTASKCLISGENSVRSSRADGDNVLKLAVSCQLGLGFSRVADTPQHVSISS